MVQFLSHFTYELLSIAFYLSVYEYCIFHKVNISMHNGFHKENGLLSLFLSALIYLLCVIEGYFP